MVLRNPKDACGLNATPFWYWSWTRKCSSRVDLSHHFLNDQLVDDLLMFLQRCQDDSFCFFRFCPGKTQDFGCGIWFASLGCDKTAGGVWRKRRSSMIADWLEKILFACLDFATFWYCISLLNKSCRTSSDDRWAVVRSALKSRWKQINRVLSQ